VDLTLKVREKGKNSIGLTGRPSADSRGAFYWLELCHEQPVRVWAKRSDLQASIGNQQRNISLGFTEAIFYSTRAIQARPSRVFQQAANKTTTQAKNYELQTGQRLNLTAKISFQNILNYTQSSTGFQLSVKPRSAPFV